MNYKYTVIEIELPEYETGSINDIDSFDNPESAFELKNTLKQKDYCCYEVIIELNNKD